MTIQEHEARVSSLLFDFPELSEHTAHAIACEQYDTEELLELKRQLSLEPDEFIETVKFIEKRGGLENNRTGDNTKPVDVEGTDGRSSTDPKEVVEDLEE